MSSSGFNDLKALIVDDFDNFRLSVMRMLQEFGFAQVDSAINGKDALRKCKATDYDLVLCDYNLSQGKTGQQVLEDVRLNRLLSESSLYVMISAESSKQIVMAAYDYEPDAYLTKPITAKTLQQRLERLIAQRKQMHPIYRALDEHDLPKAIEACRVFLSGNSRYRNHCQKLLGRLLLEHGDYAGAEGVYRDVLDVRELDWAQVGMAIARRGQEDWVGAEQWAEQALKASPLCMKAYDLQVALQRDRDDLHAQQKILQDAVARSPLSIRRQQMLGEVALVNRDIDVAVTAFRRAVKLGEHSCYDDPDTHLNFVRAASAATLASDDKNPAFQREIIKILSDFESRFGSSETNKVAVQSVGAVFKSALGDTAGAEQYLSSARKLADDFQIDPPLLIKLDWLDCYENLNQQVEYLKLLEMLQQHHHSDQSALELLDRMLDAPASQKNRHWLAEINRQGIGFYEQRKFDAAIDSFVRVSRKFPKHVGVRLNLLQAYTGKLKENSESELLAKAEQLSAEIERDLLVDDEASERYRQLKASLQEVTVSMRRGGQSG